MKMSTFKRKIFTLGIAMCFIAALGSQKPAFAVNASYLYDLSTFTGPILYDGATVYADQFRNEAYVVSRGIVQVFNENGMEIFHFNEGDGLGTISALAFDPDGTLYALSYQGGVAGNAYEIVQCNFRGEPFKSILVKGLPGDFTEFFPRYLEFRDGRFYLADPTSLRIVVTDRDGNVQKSYDLISLLELKESDRGEIEMGGFSVDRDGAILFTVTVLFSAYVLSPNGKMDSFGQPGSVPGKFANVSGILRDGKGNILVADKLKSVVNIFDGNYKFLAEFGGRGSAPGNLVVPWNLAIDGADKVYVSQASNRGVSVFRLIYD